MCRSRGFMDAWHHLQISFCRGKASITRIIASVVEPESAGLDGRVCTRWFLRVFYVWYWDTMHTSAVNITASQGISITVNTNKQRLVLIRQHMYAHTSNSTCLENHAYQLNRVNSAIWEFQQYGGDDVAKRRATMGVARFWILFFPTQLDP